jgi:hypothetical protein
MKKLLAVSALGLASVLALAEDPETLSIRLGVFSPSHSTTKNDFNQFFGFGLQYSLRELKNSTNYRSTLQLSTDYYGRGDYRHIPVLLNYVGSNKRGDSFFSVGGGLGFVGQPTATGTESVGRFAYQFGVGLNLSSGETASFVELKYFGSEATRLNGLGFYYGVRF